MDLGPRSQWKPSLVLDSALMRGHDSNYFKGQILFAVVFTEEVEIANDMSTGYSSKKEAQWPSGRVSRFRVTGSGFKSRAAQGRLGRFSLQ
ncbi:hypothetical protein TNCV_768751 [Trichonephila clavipes]|nr:hypothetical protein TNCV_768751 [Trichonephila clavipes]